MYFMLGAGCILLVLAHTFRVSRDEEWYHWLSRQPLQKIMLMRTLVTVGAVFSVLALFWKSYGH